MKMNTSTRMQLSELLKNIVSVDERLDCDVTGLSADSRTIQPGDLFIAYKGRCFDGRDHIEQAIEKGAVAVLAAAENNYAPHFNVPVVTLADIPRHLVTLARRFYQDPSQNMQVIGVTGTNGKTSICHLFAAAMAARQQRCGMMGTLGYGIYGGLDEGNLTTPDLITLQRHFSNLHVQKIKHAIMEVSAHALTQKRVEGVGFDIGVFTNLTRDHLDYYKTMENYGAAKRLLFEQFDLKTALINREDQLGQQLIDDFSSKFLSRSAGEKSLFSYALHDIKADIYAKNIVCDRHGSHALVKTPWGEALLNSHLLGLTNLSNLLAVLALLCICDVPFLEAVACLEQLSAVPGRMEAFDRKGQPLVIVDYAHTPDALARALVTCRQFCRGQLICVFGCGGDRDRGKRKMMGEFATRYADQVILTDDNPRHEDSQQIIDDILLGCTNKVTIEHDRHQAIALAVSQAQANDSANDVVLIAGKGHETYQHIGDTRLPFSDVQQVKELLF